MLIEVKDIPNGHKIKRMIVDVSFDEDDTGTVVVRDVETKLNPLDLSNTSGIVSEVPTPTSDSTEIEKPDFKIDRPKKEIPAEMLSEEF